jgi:membrane associated rhomboid family serine protease
MKKRHESKHVVHEHKHTKVESETELVKKIISWLLQPKLTIALIIANILVFLWSQTITQEVFDSLKFRPEHIIGFNLFPIVASWFLHSGWPHLTGNLIFLFVFGRVVERRFGALKTVFIFFGAAIISDIIAGLVFQQGGIGASGAIAGLIAAAVIVNPFYLNYIVFGIPIPIVILGWIAILADILGLLNPIDTNIGHIAHLAGFFGITLLIFLFNRKDEKIKTGFLVNIITAAFVLAVNFLYPNIAQRFIK